MCKNEWYRRCRYDARTTRGGGEVDEGGRLFMKVAEDGVAEERRDKGWR